jgi:hypothetical protein
MKKINNFLWLRALDVVALWRNQKRALHKINLTAWIDTYWVYINERRFISVLSWIDAVMLYDFMRQML